MSSETKTGFLLEADISGYTRFLADTEFEHANGILIDLFDTMVPEFINPLQFRNLWEMQFLLM